MTVSAGHRGGFAFIVWRQDIRGHRFGGCKRRQAGIIARDIAQIRRIQFMRQIFKCGMYPHTVFISNQRVEQVFVHLCRQIRNTGSLPLSVQAMASDASRFRNGLARGNVGRRHSFFFLATDQCQCHCQCRHDPQRKILHYKSPIET